MFTSNSRSGRSGSKRQSRRQRICEIERLEPRQLFTNAVQIEISPRIVSVSAHDIQNLGISLKFDDLLGTLTLSGNNISAKAVGNHEVVSGNVTAIDDISLSNTTSRSSVSLRTLRNPIPLNSFESTSSMRSIDLLGANLTGNLQLVASPMLVLGNASAATINITQNIPVLNFTGGDFNNTFINITNSGATQSMNLHLNNSTDTQIVTGDLIKSLRLNSFTQSAPDRGGITAGGAGSFNVLGDYKADLTFRPTLTLKYTLDNFSIRGNASGTWDIPGPSRSLYGRSFDSGYSGTFGSLGSLRVGTNFSGSFTAGSLGIGAIRDNLLGSTWNLTNPFATNSWNLGLLHVGNAIENSTITSEGNLGGISTMFTYYSQIKAGVSPSYVFGQPLSTSAYTSYSSIRSFVSDCPSHHFVHFIGSYVGAAYLTNIHLGNVQTQNNGTPFGLAGIRMDRVSVFANNETLNFKMLDSAASFWTS